VSDRFRTKREQLQCFNDVGLETKDLNALYVLYSLASGSQFPNSQDVGVEHSALGAEHIGHFRVQTRQPWKERKSRARQIDGPKYTDTQLGGGRARHTSERSGTLTCPRCELPLAGVVQINTGTVIIRYG